MADNQEIAVLAKKVYALSTLSLPELGARKWEALVIVNAVLSSATADGIAKAHADKDARWGAQIQKEGLLARLDPKWLLRTDDGRPPAIRFALESALDNPSRDLRTRLQALLLVEPADREPLADLVKALEADAWAGARGDARDAFLNVMHARSKTWFREPGLMAVPEGKGPPPLSILIEGQGETHDGGWHDDPSDDTTVEKLKFGWDNAIRTWDVDFLRDNPLSQLYLSAESAATTAVETAGDLASGANEAARGIAAILKWAPYVAAGIAALGITTAMLVAARR